MVAADQAAYTASDQYMSRYYPALTQARDDMIGQAYKAATGPLDPSVQNTFMNNANMQSASAFGGGDPTYGFGGAGAGSSWGGKGSLARNAAAANVAQNTQAYQDYNRSLFQTLNSMYAPRTFGMTPEDAANVFTFNNTQYNNFLEQKFAGDTQAYYQNAGLAAGQQAQGLGLITSVLGAAATAY